MVPWVLVRTDHSLHFGRNAYFGIPPRTGKVPAPSILGGLRPVLTSLAATDIDPDAGANLRWKHRPLWVGCQDHQS